MLARVFHDAGYRTGAFVGAYVLNHIFGLADGFEVYDDRVHREIRRAGNTPRQHPGQLNARDEAEQHDRQARSPLLVLLGLTWPSVYTIVALACLPSAFLFLGEVVRPSLADRRWVRAYGTAAVILASASLAYQTLWDIMGASSPHAAHGSRPLLHRPGPRR